MQPRVLHLLNHLGLDPQLVPASNVVFVRSATEEALRDEKAKLLKSCWPVHQAVIEALGPRTILCFGSTAGHWVREALNVQTRVANFREKNARGWTSEAHTGVDGKCVITLTHPGRADWRNPDADPTPLVRQMLDRN